MKVNTLSRAVAEPADEPCRSGANVICVGVQKCATSFIHSAMGTHPQAGISAPKELDFFSYFFDRGYSWYEKHFSACVALPVRFEASPSYFYDPRSPERIRGYRPEMKIIVLLRDPVERAYSNHLHEVIQGHIGAVPFEEGLANNPGYIDQGRYATHLRRWFSQFERDSILVMFAEEISADPIGAAQKVYAFSGLDAEHVSPVLLERRNESDRARLPALRAVLRAGGDKLRDLGLEDQLARVKAAGPVQRLLAANSQNMRGIVPPMNEATRARLTEVFEEELLALPELLRRESLPWATYERLCGLPAASGIG
ncbi:sulfotransferase domain-containing protein [Alloyangia pacifica]|uniref:Sulfotransferase domain-containing protein n=1 Tax=Alloyangia pacifica TaxID=311180 RepID=A0A1I6WF29_9RHOB|nr:sulfotransferase domain-containing protein [Alloyangia pacifica]SDI62519.1 Sulfotransferase domain-containing protein [Alloyangia pacifica]SFT24341.1 Sulfotransferase domain-containing protein [Alloyangia pacifica]